jgi:hypothetical protein
MTVTRAINQNNLGNQVSTRDYNWLEMCQSAWGSEFYAPDHAIYRWGNGREFDSSDKGLTGIYGVQVTDDLWIDDNYPDMRTALTDGVEDIGVDD